MKPYRRVALVSFVVASIVLLIAGVGAPRIAAEDAQRITGSWSGTAVATSVPLPPLKDLLTFTSDGSVLETRRLFLANSPIGPLLGTPGHGSWVKTASNEYAVTLMIIYEGAETHPTASGEVVAIEKVRFKLKLGPGADRLTGTLLDEIRDTNGDLIFRGPGTFEASRIRAEPLD